MLAFIGKLIAGKFIQSELEKVKAELRSLVRQLVNDAVNEAIRKLKDQNQPKPS